MNFRDMEPFRQAAERAAQAYEGWRGWSLQVLCRSENATFLVRDTRTSRPLYTLRVSRPGCRTEEEVWSEIRWLEKLREEGLRKEGFSVVQPVMNREGSFITVVYAEGTATSLGGESRGGAAFLCVLFHYMEGETPKPEEKGEEDFRKIGRIAACLHLQTTGWKDSRSLIRPHWDYEGMIGTVGYFGDWRACSQLSTEGYACLENACRVIGERLEKYGKSDETYGLIHGDLRAANLVKKGGRLQVLDFDDCGFGWFLYDLAASLSFVETDERVPRWIGAWLEGYESLRYLSESDRAEIPTFLMARRIQLLAWIVSHPDSDPVAGYRQGFAEGTVKLAAEYVNRYL